MLINEAIQTENGTVQIKGELSPQELGLVLSLGLNLLYQQGAIPFLVNKEDQEKAQAETDSVIQKASH